MKVCKQITVVLATIALAFGVAACKPTNTETKTDSTATTATADTASTTPAATTDSASTTQK